MLPSDFHFIMSSKRCWKLLLSCCECVNVVVVVVVDGNGSVGDNNADT